LKGEDEDEAEIESARRNEGAAKETMDGKRKGMKCLVEQADRSRLKHGGRAV